MDPLTIGGLAFTAATVASLAGLHLGKVVVPRVGRWYHNAPIHVHHNAPVHAWAVDQAAQKWRSRGHPLGPVLVTGHLVTPIPGAILIVPGTGRQREPGIARFAVDTDVDLRDLPEEDHYSRADDILGPVQNGEIRHAVIELPPPLPHWDMELIVMHELGHALGLLHCETALLGRKRRDSKRRPKGSARMGIVGRKSGHIMHPLHSKVGTDFRGITP